MEGKLIKIEDITGKYCIINTECISSVRETSTIHVTCTTIKLTDNSEVDTSLSVSEVYDLIKKEE